MMYDAVTIVVVAVTLPWAPMIRREGIDSTIRARRYNKYKRVYQGTRFKMEYV